ncbi:MAG: hypothetical protein VB106_09485 [Clostridiaceae bacterium]|nr:hypothetical protein [Clostridiaceae bacterium]
MKILLVISFLIPLIFLGHLMSELDIFLSNNAIAIANADRSASAIVLGKNDLAEKIIGLLENKELRVIRLTDPFQLIQERKLYYLFALSESDADNIAFYKIGEKLYGIEKKISICNDKRNENMFISENINYISNAKASADKLFQMVLQQAEVKRESYFK